MISTLAKLSHLQRTWEPLQYFPQTNSEIVISTSSRNATEYVASGILQLEPVSTLRAANRCWDFADISLLSVGMLMRDGLRSRIWQQRR